MYIFSVGSSFGVKSVWDGVLSGRRPISGISRVHIDDSLFEHFIQEQEFGKP